MKTAFAFDSFNEVQIKGYIWQDDQLLPRAVVIIAHGMAETIARYSQFASYLASNGIVVYGYSHRGHFETAGDLKRLGYLGQNGWSKMATDLHTVVGLAKQRFVGVPVFILGHSMGSYVTRTYLIDYPSEVNGIILSGTGYPSKLELQAASILAKMERQIKGKDLPSSLMDKMSFGAFNKPFQPNKTNFDWLSSDLEQVQKYIDDPWCGNVHPASFFEDMARNLVRVLYQQSPKPLSPLPMMVMSGALDPVGQQGKGVKKSADFYHLAGYKVTLKLYDGGRHEMLNEVNREQVYSDILEWLNQYS